jgi:hypothetical protein
MVLFDADPSAVAALTDQIVAAVVDAVTSGALTRGQLMTAVAHVLAAKHVEMCPAG